MVRASKIAASGRATALAGLCVFGCLGWLAAQEPSRSARGGAQAKASGYQFEVFFYPTGLRVFPTDSKGAAVDASRVAGTATFYHPSSPEPWFTRPLNAATGRGATSLDLPINLATVPPAGAKVEFEITGLPGDAEGPATFTVPVEFVRGPAEGASAPPSRTAAAEPAYVYGPGAAGFRYYAFAGPQVAPSRPSNPTTQTAPVRTSSTNRPSGSTSSSRTRGIRDWSTGRNNMRIAKPWLNPRD